MERVLAISLVNNHLGFAFRPTTLVFAHKLAVILGDSRFAVLQLNFHYHWSWHHSSTMRVGINYSPSDCFETFPFPEDLSPSNPSAPSTTPTAAT